MINYIQRYLFTCVKNLYYENDESDHTGSNIYKISITLSCKNDKIYIPIIYYSISDEFDNIKENGYYYNIFINYNNYKDIYDLIQILSTIFVKHVTISEDIIICTAIVDTNWERSFKENTNYKEIKNINLNLEYFINKCNDLCNADNYLQKINESNNQELINSFNDIEYQPSDNIKLKTQFNILKEWLI
jgi:hypothetical protein